MPLTMVEGGKDGPIADRAPMRVAKAKEAREESWARMANQVARSFHMNSKGVGHMSKGNKLAHGSTLQNADPRLSLVTIVT